MCDPIAEASDSMGFDRLICRMKSSRVAVVPASREGASLVSTSEPVRGSGYFVLKGLGVTK